MSYKEREPILIIYDGPEIQARQQLKELSMNSSITDPSLLKDGQEHNMPMLAFMEGKWI